MSSRHASDADAKSAGRVIACLDREAEERIGTEQGVLWSELALILARRWPQPPDQDEAA